MKPIREQIERLLVRSVRTAFPQLPTGALTMEIEVPAKPQHGDYASSVPLRLASVLKQNPLAIAEALAQAWPKSTLIQDAIPAAPGFLNFRLHPKWLNQRPAEIIKMGELFGKVDEGRGQRVLVEFISANPTGPLHVGTGRGAFTGDVLANILALANYRVTREYYLNDIGQQVATLAESATRRYFQQQGIPIDFPETCYQGEYVADLAKGLKLERVRLANLLEVRDRIQVRVLQMMVNDIKKLVEKKLKIRMDSWFSEASLYNKKITDQALRFLENRKLTYEQDQATWLKTTAYGDDKDRVLRKTSGDQTYFLSDVALMWYRFRIRKFDRAVIVLGADHHGFIKRLQAAAQMIGVEPERLTTPLVQLVRLMENGVEIKMSKRRGTFITLEELVDEVGLDAARFFFLMHDAGTHMDFDLQLAKERSQKNPVFYVQYAHARISGILKKVAQLKRRQPELIKEPLTHPTELALVRALVRFPDLVLEIARTGALQRLPVAAMELATRFHEFYDQRRVTSGQAVYIRREELTAATGLILRRMLNLMGVSAPVRM